MIKKPLAFGLCCIAFSATKAQTLIDTAIIKPILQQHISALAHDSMHGRASGSVGNIKARNYIENEFEKIGLRPGLEGSYYLPVTVDERFLGGNVLGILYGKDSVKRKQYVLFTAHYDHVGGSFNGANDNASGTATMLAIAKQLAKDNNNAYTVLFVAFTAEELGMIGSQDFISVIDSKKVKYVLNFEMLGRKSTEGTIARPFLVGSEDYLYAKKFNAYLKELGTAVPKNYFTGDPFPQYQLAKRSDHYSFNLKSIDANTVMLSAPYDEHYHQETDEYDTIDFEAMTSVVQILIFIAQKLVQ
jgi:hypothetical protein